MSSGAQAKDRVRRMRCTKQCFLIGIAVLLVALAAVGLGVWLKGSPRSPIATRGPGADTKGPRDVVSSADHGPEVTNLVGRWQRRDGGCIIQVTSVAEDGRLDAAYFNSKPIHVRWAEASRTGSVVEMFVLLRGTDGPGSSYTLAYVPASDRLKGTCYQALTREEQEVQFVRLK